MAQRNVIDTTALQPGTGIGSFFAGGTTLAEKRRVNARNPRYSTSRAIGFRGDLNDPFAAAAPTGSPQVNIPATPQPGLARQEPGEGGFGSEQDQFNGFGSDPFNPAGVDVTDLTHDTAANRDFADALGGMPMSPEGKIEAMNPGSVGKGFDYETTAGLVGTLEAVNSAQPGDITLGVPESQDPFDFSSAPSPGESFDASSGSTGGFEQAPGGAGADVTGAPGTDFGGGFDAGGYGGQGDFGAGAGEGVGGDGGGAGCFITEAVMSAGGQGDAAPELQVLRQFRDQVMMNNPVGQSLVSQYEAIAPIVVEGISQQPDGMQLFQQIKAEYIDKAVAAIQAGQTEEALRIYAAMIAFVTPIAIEVATGQGGDGADRPVYGDGMQEGMDALGTNAALLEHSPEMRTMATGDMQHPSPPQPGAPTGAAAMNTMFAPAAANPVPAPRAPAYARRY